MSRETICHSRTCKERNRQPERCLIYLRWSDASYQTGDGLYLQDLEPEVLIETAGFLIQETETHYSVALDHYAVAETWRHVANIPKGMVRQAVKFPWPEVHPHPDPPLSKGEGRRGEEDARKIESGGVL